MMDRMTRRGLFAAALGALMGIVTRAVPAAANNGDALIVGEANKGGPTSLLGANEATLSVRFGDVSAPSMVDLARNERGITTRGFDVGLDTDGDVHIGRDLAVDRSFSTADAHVTGQTTLDGAVIVGGDAQFDGLAAFGGVAVAALVVRKTTVGSHPARGEPGTFYVNRSGELWYCRGGRRWAKLA